MDFLIYFLLFLIFLNFFLDFFGISGSTVTVILLKGLILPVGGVAWGRIFGASFPLVRRSLGLS